MGHGEHEKEDRWGNVQSLSSASRQDLLVHGGAQGKRGDLQLGTLRSCKFLAASLGLGYCRSWEEYAGAAGRKLQRALQRARRVVCFFSGPFSREKISTSGCIFVLLKMLRI